MNDRLRGQTPPLGNWLAPMKFTGTLQGCAGNQAEAFYSVHSSLIPVGPHRGKILVWDPARRFCAVSTTDS